MDRALIDPERTIVNHEPDQIVSNDFWWEVRVHHSSNAGDRDEVYCSVKIPLFDENGVKSKINLEMDLVDLSELIRALESGYHPGTRKFFQNRRRK